MKKLIIGLGLVLLLFTGSAFGAIWDGSLKGEVHDTSFIGDGVIATGAWRDASLAWDISLDESLYTYTYTFNSNSKKAISHFNLELSTTIHSANHFEILEPYDDVDYGTFSWKNGNPGLVFPFYGLKYDFDKSAEMYSATFTIITSRTPMAGDFYAKDGYSKLCCFKIPNFFWAHNSVPVPNKADTPIPGAVVILGSGMLCLVGARKQFLK